MSVEQIGHIRPLSRAHHEQMKFDQIFALNAALDKLASDLGISDPDQMLGILWDEGVLPTDLVAVLITVRHYELYRPVKTYALWLDYRVRDWFAERSKRSAASSESNARNAGELAGQLALSLPGA